MKKPPGVQMYRSAAFDTQKETYSGILQASDLVAAVKVPFDDVSVYRGTSLIRKRLSVGPCSTTKLRALWWS